MTTENLEPCPFCGSADIDPAGWMTKGGEVGPACGECGATAESAAAWNKRAPAAVAGVERDAARWRKWVIHSSFPKEEADSIVDALAASAGKGGA
jgi:hypothetical protein